MTLLSSVLHITDRNLNMPRKNLCFKTVMPADDDTKQFQCSHMNSLSFNVKHSDGQLGSVIDASVTRRPVGRSQIIQDSLVELESI